MEVEQLKGRLNLLATVLRLGHESFSKSNLKSLTYHILNNSREILPYTRCCLADLRGRRPKIIGVMGQSVVVAQSEYCLHMRQLLRPFRKLSQATSLDDDFIQQQHPDRHLQAAWQYFQQNDNERQGIILIPLRHPHQDRGVFLWVVEYPVAMEKATNSLILLANHYAQAWWFHLARTHWLRSCLSWLGRTFLRPLTILLVLIAVGGWSLFYVKVNIMAAADFEVIPAHYAISYAPLQGMIGEICCHNGAVVKKGQVVLKYDTQELLFELLMAQKRYQQVYTKLEETKLEAFSNVNKRGEVKLLELQMQEARIKIDEIRWRLAQCTVKAEQAGVLVMDESETLLGREIKAGDQLFEVIATNKLLARIELNETDAAILSQHFTITLYFHTHPETPVVAKLLSISPKPILTTSGQFCYRLKVKFTPKGHTYLCGMRGVARMTGQQVTLGYYLFRNLIMSWRRF